VSFDEEYRIAERALSAYELADSTEPVFPPAAQRIRRARETLGLTQEVATRWGEQVSMYWDLELYDAEVFTVISVRQVYRLAVVLGTSVNAVLFGGEPAMNSPKMPYTDVVSRLRVRMADDAISPEQLGDHIGWDIRGLLADSDALGDLPIDGLRAVCQAAGVDWMSVLSIERTG